MTFSKGEREGWIIAEKKWKYMDTIQKFLPHRANFNQTYQTSPPPPNDIFSLIACLMIALP